MTEPFRRLLCAAALTATAGLPAAHAAVIDFEPAALAGLYLPDDTFAQLGYTLTTKNDFGIVDTAAALGGISPTGDATQFYFNSNDGALVIARTDASLFSLQGFSAAFVPLDPPSAQTTVIVAVGTKADNSLVTASWSFAPSVTGHFPFSVYSGAGFAAFSNLAKVEFHACSLVGSLTCSVPTQNNGQFAIDDIVVTAVPEPASTALLLIGLTGLALRARRSAR